MPTLDKIVEGITPDKVHRDFRLWLTSMPTARFPVSILQNGVKLTVEPPKGLKANLLRTYATFSDDTLNACPARPVPYRRLLFALCLFHAVIQERRKFGPLGWNIPYEFTDGDLRICVRQLRMFLEEAEAGAEVPFKVLRYTVGEINYGGRVTDDWDRRLLMTLLADYYAPGALDEAYRFSASDLYYTLGPNEALAGYRAYIKALPLEEPTDIFGMLDNANITFAQKETFSLFESLLLLGGGSEKKEKSSEKSSEGKGEGKGDKATDKAADKATDKAADKASDKAADKASDKAADKANDTLRAGSREAVLLAVVSQLSSRIPQPFDFDAVAKRYPVQYRESMSTVLVQEVVRYNRLLTVIHDSLRELGRALRGLVVMSEALERMANAMWINQVPRAWADRAYPSLKGLAAWADDLCARTAFLQAWIDRGIPAVFWLSGFFFPQAFLTGTLQNYARKHGVSIDTLAFDFRVMDAGSLGVAEKVDAASGVRAVAAAVPARPEDGCYVWGLFLEGARWDPRTARLAESRPKELYTEMPVLWLRPVQHAASPTPASTTVPSTRP